MVGKYIECERCKQQIVKEIMEAFDKCFDFTTGCSTGALAQWVSFWNKYLKQTEENENGNRR